MQTYRIETITVGLASAAVLALWTLFAGKDLSWDLLNHQLYLPFSLLSGRFATDLLAAGPQSTQNPIGYLPFYLLAHSPLPGWAAGTLSAAAVTGVTALALHRIAGLVLGSDRAGRDWRLVAVALAIGAPVYLLVVGGASTDPWWTALALVALAIVLDQRQGAAAMAWAGAAAGLAAAIKPTSLVVLLPLALLVVLQTSAGRRSWAHFACGCTAAFAVFMATGGWWALWLWREFGSPTYPLLNHWFQSPSAPAGPTVALRFLPITAIDWFTRPFELVQFKSFVSLEAAAPDLRPAVAIVAGMVAAAVASRRSRTAWWTSPQVWLRADVQLALFIAVAYVLWMATSGNARYAMPWFLLIAVLLVRAVQVISASRVALLGLLTLLGLQITAFVSESDRRLIGGQPWDAGPYAPFEVPRRLTTEPFLHLSLGVQSHAGVAPYLHPAGAFINLTGQMSLPPNGPLANRLQQRLAAWTGRTRFLFAPRQKPGTERYERSLEGDNWMLANRFGLRVDTTECETIRIRTEPVDRAGRLVVSCRAIPSDTRDPTFERAVAAADRVFALLESACPHVYGPQPLVSDANPGAIWRRYMNSDTVVQISPIDGVLVSYHRARNPIYLGTPEQVIANQGKDGCRAWNQLLSQG